MIITAEPSAALFWEQAGVDIIFIDLETIGKMERQSHVNSVKSQHSIDDISIMRSVLSYAKILVRINPLNSGSETEIEAVISAGADIIMLPMFKEVSEVEIVLKQISGRCQLYPLLETPAALAIAQDLAGIEGVSGYHFGLNDLHLAMGKSFMFEVMLEPVFRDAVRAFSNNQVFFGIGGVSRVGTGTLLSEVIIRENFHLGAKRVILSRSFKSGISTGEEATKEIEAIQSVYKECKFESLPKNRAIFKQQVEAIANYVN